MTRVLAMDVPVLAASCSVVLEGRFSRKNSYSPVTTLATRSSKAKSLVFSASQLPAVKPDVFRKQTIQPSLHLRAVTECVDSNGASVFSDTTPVVARYAECGFSKRPVRMASFVSTLKRKLRLKVK